MSNSVELKGSVVAGAPNCGGCEDGALITMSLGFKGGCCAKPYNVATGGNPRNVQSPGVYLTLTDIGPTGVVTRADTLILWTRALMLFRLTTDDGLGGSVVSVVPVDGLFIVEFPSTRFLKLLEVQGSGIINYFASGQV